jgi:hypothetical protein
MIKLTNTRLLALVSFVLSIGVFTACKKDDNKTSSSKIELLSFGPTGAKHGDTLTFFGNNLNKVTAIQFTGTGAGATVNESDFKSQTSDRILVLVPTAAEKGFVTLKTPEGDIVSKTQLNLGVTPTLTSMTLQARPGENITLTGNYLNWVKSITFTRDKTVQTFVSKTINQLVVTVPADAQTGPLVIAYGGTDSMSVETKDTLKVTLPLITGVAPNPVKHGTNLTITGTNLDLAKQVLFTGNANPVTTFVSQSATQLVVVVPPSTTKGKVTLAAASGVTTVSTMDLDVVLPTITNMTPNPVDTLTNVTITGTNLDVVSSASFVGVNTAVSTFVSQSPTQLVVRVPGGAISGKLTLNVKNSTLSVKSSNDLSIVGSSVPPIIIYDDAVTAAWNGWVGGGWGGNKDYNNTSPVRQGSKSIKIDYVGGYGSPFQLGGANISLAGYTKFKISVYGAPGSGGKTVSVAFNQVNNKYNINVVEGQWTDYEIPIATLTSSTALNEIWVQEFSGTGGFTIYIDAIGLY